MEHGRGDDHLVKGFVVAPDGKVCGLLLLTAAGTGVREKGVRRLSSVHLLGDLQAGLEALSTLDSMRVFPGPATLSAAYERLTRSLSCSPYKASHLLLV